MPTPYKEIVDWNGGTQEVFDKMIRFALPDVQKLGGAHVDCPGTRIVAAAAANTLYADPFLKLFFTYSSPPFTGTWRWNGSAGGSSFSGLLDPDKTTGECLHFVKNFYILCRAPAPYGLGMECTEITIPPKYEGESGHGFVSVHNGIYLQLQSNVVPGPSYAGPPLYSWENHKVVWRRSSNLYFDPCYRTNYQNLQDMAEYHYTGREVIMDDTTNAGKAMQDGRFAYEARKAGRFFYFRYRSNAEQLRDPRAMQGPYSETEFDMACQSMQGLKVK